MYSIGDLSQLAGVTPRMLRHYHELGLLVPAEVDQAATRLEGVEAHIHRLEHQMNERPTRDVTVATKRLPAVHLAVASAVSPSFASADIGPVIKPLYPKLIEALDAAGVEIAGPSIAYYDDDADGGIGVHAGFPVDVTVTSVSGVEIVDLPEVELAATALHYGDMATVDVDTVPTIFDWMRSHGFRTTGYSREHYLDCPDDITRWRTEMQFPIEPDPHTA